MSANQSDFVLPRPGAPAGKPTAPIPAPTEAAFVNTFGHLLPPAQFLDTLNGKAAYYEFRPEESEVTATTPDRVVLIHGVQTPALGMFPLTHALRASFPHAHFVLLDLWGHGLSETPILPHEAGLFHTLIDALLDRLQWTSAHFVGYSFGAVLTVGYVASRKSKVKSFALVAPAGLIRRAELTTEQQAYLQGSDEEAARKWIIEFLEGGELLVPVDWEERVEKGEVVAEAVRAWQMREHQGHLASVVGIFRDGGVMDNDSLFKDAAQTHIPSIVILGELDDLCTREELNNLGFADVKIIPEAGHAVVRVQAMEVANYVAQFWTGRAGN